MPHVSFMNVPAHGHVNPTIGVVAELVRRGCRVTYHCGEPYRAAVEAAGATFRPYEPGWIDDNMPHDGGDMFELARVVRRAATSIVPALLPQLARHPPDVIVHDALAPWGRELAVRLALPAVASLTTLVIDYRIAFARPDLLMRVVGQHAARLPSPIELRAAFDALAYRERVNLVYTSRAFQPAGDRLDGSFVFVGHVPRDEPPLDAELAALERPIYVSLGTLFNARPAVFRAAAEALSGLGHPVVISTGGRLAPEDIGPIPPGTIVRRWVPQLTLLRRAALAVTHGGMNTVNEALACDVPLVVVPQAADQPWIAKRVAELGAGVAAFRPTPETLRAAASRGLGAEMRAAARRVGASLRAAGGAALAADAILAAATPSRSVRRAAC